MYINEKYILKKQQTNPMFVKNQKYVDSCVVEVCHNYFLHSIFPFRATDRT